MQESVGDSAMFLHLPEVAKAVAAERERCAKIADDWLALWSMKQPEHVSAQKWACDAVKDIADAIRGAR